MKRALSFVVLLIVCSQYAGVYCYFAFRLIDIKKEVRESLRQSYPNSLTRLVLSINQYEALRNDDQELTLNGKMYDIAHVTFSDDSVEVLAIHDEAETDLLKFAQTVFTRHTTDRKQVPQCFLQFFHLTYLPTSFAFSAMARQHAQPLCNWSVQYLSPTLGSESPPPWC